MSEYVGIPRTDVILSKLERKLDESEEREQLAQETQWAAHNRIIAEWAVQRRLREQIEAIRASQTDD